MKDFNTLVTATKDSGLAPPYNAGPAEVVRSVRFWLDHFSLKQKKKKKFLVRFDQGMAEKVIEVQ